MNELSQILNKNEKVLWEGTPQFGPYVARIISVGLAIAFFISLVFVPVGASLLFDSLIDPLEILIPLSVPFIILFGIFGIGTGYALLVYDHIYYVITDKRVILQGGLIGRDYKIVDFDKIQNAEVNVGVFDKLFGNSSGTISIATAGTIGYGKYGSYQLPYRLQSVGNPYKVFEHLKQVSHDVKTDIEYPNALRPSKNPGYKTDYSPEKK